jgi:hypothetical protein
MATPFMPVPALSPEPVTAVRTHHGPLWDIQWLRAIAALMAALHPYHAFRRDEHIMKYPDARNRAIVPRWVAASLLLALPLAHAQLAPFVVSLGETVAHDSNILRGVAGSEVADWQTDTRLRVDYSDRIGRHQARAWASADNSRYRHSSQLNNTGYLLGAEFDWTSANQWSGRIGFDDNSNLYRAGLSGDQSYQGKSMLHAQRGGARVSSGGSLAFEGGLELSRAVNSASALAINDTRQWVGDLGVSYAQSPDVRISVLGRRTEGRYPNFLPLPDDFHRNDLVFGANWTNGGLSSLQAQVAYTQEGHSEFSGRHYWTGFLRGQWQVSGHVFLSASLARDSTQNLQGGVLGSSSGTDAQGGTAGGQAVIAQQSPSINHSADLAARWQLTSKIDMTGTYLQTSRHYSNVPLGAVVLNGSDTTSQYQIGLSYLISRGLRTGCSGGRSTHSPGDLVALSSSFASNTYSCMAEFSLH